MVLIATPLADIPCHRLLCELQLCLKWLDKAQEHNVTKDLRAESKIKEFFDGTARIGDVSVRVLIACMQYVWSCCALPTGSAVWKRKACRNKSFEFQSWFKSSFQQSINSD